MHSLVDARLPGKTACFHSASRKQFTRCADFIPYCSHEYHEFMKIWQSYKCMNILDKMVAHATGAQFNWKPSDEMSAF